MKDSDKLLNIISDNNLIQCYFADVTETVREAQRLHGFSMVSTVVFSQALCATTLLSGSLKNDNDILSLNWSCNGPVDSIYCEIDSFGNIKGFLGNNNLEFIENTFIDGHLFTEKYIGFGELAVSRKTFDNKPFYRSVVVIETGEIVEDISIYLEHSLQIKSVFYIIYDIGNDMVINSVKGTLFMLMPGAGEKEFEKIKDDFTFFKKNDFFKVSSEKRIDLLNNKLYKVIGERAINYRCKCSLEKIKNMIDMLSDEQSESFKDEDGKIRVDCQFCNKQYVF